MAFVDLDWWPGVQGRISGFRRAAEVLYSSMLGERSVEDLDTVFFPYAACWRHHLELQLKSLIAQLHARFGLPIQRRHHHRIDQLWQETRKLVLDHNPQERADLASVGKVIGQLAKVDPVGEAFRYAADKRGHETLRAVDRINLVAFHDALLSVANYLDALDTGVSEYLSTQQEIDSYYAAEFGVEDW